MIQDIILHKLKLSVEQKLSKQEFNFNIDRYVDIASQNFVYKLKAEICGEHHKEKITVPEDWFQMFKKQYFPNWLLKKFPIKNRILGVLDLYQLYPHIKASIPEERHYVHFPRYLKDV